MDIGLYFYFTNICSYFVSCVGFGFFPLLAKFYELIIVARPCHDPVSHLT